MRLVRVNEYQWVLASNIAGVSISTDEPSLMVWLKDGNGLMANAADYDDARNKAERIVDEVNRAEGL